MLFLRTHLMEDTVGKLSETYEFTPRFILGYETAEGVGARARYFTYGRQTRASTLPDDIRFEFDVFDVEATAKFQSCRNELVLAGGFRFASWDAAWDGEEVGIDAPGITVAADFRTWSVAIAAAVGGRGQCPVVASRRRLGRQRLRPRRAAPRRQCGRAGIIRRCRVFVPLLQLRDVGPPCVRNAELAQRRAVPDRPAQIR